MFLIVALLGLRSRTAGLGSRIRQGRVLACLLLQAQKESAFGLTSSVTNLEPASFSALRRRWQPLLDPRPMHYEPLPFPSGDPSILPISERRNRAFPQRIAAYREPGAYRLTLDRQNSWTRRSGTRSTNRFKDSMPKANSPKANALFSNPLERSISKCREVVYSGP
jgi:hypothetical protein